MINVASGDRNAIWPPRCRDALMASQQGRGKALSRWQRDKWRWDGSKDCRQDKEKEKSHGSGGKKTKQSKKNKKTKMDHKMDLINLDFEPPLTDKSSAEEEEEVKLFLGMCSPSTSSHLPSFFLSILLSTQVGKAKGRMASDNAAAPVE